jgi:hypothetical protein
VNEAFQAAMLFAKAERLPDFRTTALDEVFAIRILVDHELDDALMRLRSP